MAKHSVGISGISVYLPPYRVNLEDWCNWTGNSWDKVQNVVGRSFRVRGPEHNAYTLAANAVLGLIDNYDIDPDRIRFLGFGTESSTDNSAGAVIVKGMLDDALASRGQPTLPRSCEVPEFKHACLGGVYALKNSARYIATDGHDTQAIVVCADVAEYARGSTGEPTQGAGAVAMLVEGDPALVELELKQAGSSSDYRGPDFRKPLSRLFGQRPRPNGQLQDLPVFNGKYSTTCYTDATLLSLDDMFQRRGIDRSRYYRELEAVFMHRPYRRMPETGWAMGYLFALARGDESDKTELKGYCDAAGVDFEGVFAEMYSRPKVRELVHRGTLDEDVYPMSAQLLRAFRKSPVYRSIVLSKMELGSDLMMEVGNIYSGALLAWLAAGFEEALNREHELTGKELLMIGYGSGDASEAIPVRVAEGWREAAAKIQFAEALEFGVDLVKQQYEAFHDGIEMVEQLHDPAGEFIVERIGERTDEHFQDTGLEYYRYIPESAASAEVRRSRIKIVS